MRSILLCLALVGCTAEHDVHSAKIRAKQEKAEAAASKTPIPRTFFIDGNELKIIDVPVKDSSGYVDIQRCFLWRDQEFKTASLQCPSEMTEPLPEAGATPDFQNH